MITRQLLKREIDKVRDEHLPALYNINKVFELPAGELLADATSIAAAETTMDWEKFIQETYGCLQDDHVWQGE